MQVFICREGLEVTDDVSIVEHLKHPVYITEGSYTNIKVHLFLFHDLLEWHEVPSSVACFSKEPSSCSLEFATT